MQKLSSVLTIKPENAMISLVQARAQVRWHDGVDVEVDANLALLIEAVMSHLDGVGGVLGRAMVSQTWVDVASGFPGQGEFPVALAPLMSVSEITYYDANNVQRVFDPVNYGVFNRYDCGYVKCHSQVSWPSTFSRDDAVSVTYVAGYGETAADVPAAIRLAALELIAHWFENREAVLVGSISSTIPLGFERKLRPFMRPKF